MMFEAIWLYFNCVCTIVLDFYFWWQIWHHIQTRRPQYPIKVMKFWRYESVWSHFWRNFHCECAVFLLPLTSPTSDSESSTPISCKGVHILAIRQHLWPFLAKFSLCMRFEIRSLIRTRRHRFPIKVLKFGQYGRKFGVIFGDFWTAHARWRYISSSGNKSDVRFALDDPDFL